MNPILEASITPEEAAALRKARDVLVALAAGGTCFFPTTRYEKFGLVSYVPGRDGGDYFGDKTKKSAGRWHVTEKGMALIRNA